MVIIGTFLPECLHSLAAALKFDGVNPVPDMTKRKTASKLITRGSWPSARKAIVNVSLTRSNTSLKELNLCLVMQGLSLPQNNGLRGHVSGCIFFAFLNQIPKIYLDRSPYINKDYKIRSELLSK